MLRKIKSSALRALNTSGVFQLLANSRWRQSRLLILCYHGISLEDEHEWRPALYMTSAQLEERFTILKDGGYNVLPLGDAWSRLQNRELPPRSVVLTFDDGGYDFYKSAAPLLTKFQFPATVYQTTYYTEYPKPVFNLVCSYILWKKRADVLDRGAELGIEPHMDLRTMESRKGIMQQILRNAQQQQWTGAQCNDVAAQLAKILGINYDAILSKRLLQLMTPAEVAQLSREGIDFQLHTHRHRTPNDEALFRKEIRENRDHLRQITGRDPVHFCYPSGVYERQFLPWLASEKVVSATTCDIGMATRFSPPLLLPRFVDTTGTTRIVFESWLTGVGQLLSHRRNQAAD
jgi:peptidoglycan/xylan/chitin deacetylase (PgdA/CDA1 family)